MTSTRSCVVALAVVLATGLPLPVRAQTSLQIPLQFDFLNPGAKSLAMGGAFSGVADDATATLANPAGLIQIGQREVSLEGRLTRNDSRFLQGGRLSGTVLNEGLDTVSGPQFADSRGTHAGPTFLSVVLPFARTDPADPRVGQTRWVLAAQRHELVRVDQQFQSTGVFQQAPGDLTSIREKPQQADRQLSITSYGLSMAYAVRPGIAVGGGLALYRFSIDSIFRRFDTIGFLGAPNPGNEQGRSTQTGDDTGVAPSLGLLFGTGGRTRAGVLYRHGPSFTFQTVEALGDPERDVTFRVPHTLAIGVSHRPRPSILVALEVTRVNYARLEREFVTDQARNTGRARSDESFRIDDGTEVHLGAQYLKIDWRWAPKFRAGVWYDPDHSVRYRPATSPVTKGEGLFDERYATALSTGEDRIHGSAGLGLSISPRIEWNLGADVAAGNVIVSTSIIVRAGSR